MGWLKGWRRRRHAERTFPQDWLAVVERNVPVYGILPPEDREELRRHVLVFMAEKEFEGCFGLEMTDEIRVTVAAQACILLLHRETDYYPGLRSVLVYPKAYVGQRQEYLESGFVLEGPEERLGEAWHRGPIILSWNDVLAGAADWRDGINVVFHEFAHQIDSSSGKGDNTPVLQRRSDFVAWAKVLRTQYRQLRRAVYQNLPHLLDEYGATSPSEFFAVATEYFFERACEVREQQPELYDAMKTFYQQDPARSWRW